jgi:hypothetical protein
MAWQYSTIPGSDRTIHELRAAEARPKCFCVNRQANAIPKKRALDRLCREVLHTNTSLEEYSR